MIEDYADRHHAFEGCFNFRDVGGYVGRDGRRVKWGKYFRAGRQDRMTAADLEQLETMSIGTQIDLRGNEEIADQGAWAVTLARGRFTTIYPLSPPAAVII